MAKKVNTQDEQQPTEKVELIDLQKIVNDLQQTNKKLESEKTSLMLKNDEIKNINTSLNLEIEDLKNDVTMYMNSIDTKNKTLMEQDILIFELNNKISEKVVNKVIEPEPVANNIFCIYKKGDFVKYPEKWQNIKFEIRQCVEEPTYNLLNKENNLLLQNIPEKKLTKV